MATFTEHMNLLRPTYSDQVDVETQISENLDKLDPLGLEGIKAITGSQSARTDFALGQGSGTEIVRITTPAIRTIVNRYYKIHAELQIHNPSAGYVRVWIRRSSISGAMIKHAETDQTEVGGNGRTVIVEGFDNPGDNANFSWVITTYRQNTGALFDIKNPVFAVVEDIGII